MSKTSDPLRAALTSAKSTKPAKRTKPPNPHTPTHTPTPAHPPADTDSGAPSDTAPAAPAPEVKKEPIQSSDIKELETVESVITDAKMVTEHGGGCIDWLLRRK